jgi:hypothetical protein
MGACDLLNVVGDLLLIVKNKKIARFVSLRFASLRACFTSAVGSQGIAYRKSEGAR